MFTSIEEQLQLFKNCRYVVEANKIDIGSNRLLDKKRFNVEFGGRVFALDVWNGATTRSAWNAFINVRRRLHP